MHVAPQALKAWGTAAVTEETNVATTELITIHNSGWAVSYHPLTGRHATHAPGGLTETQSSAIFGRWQDDAGIRSAVLNQRMEFERTNRLATLNIAVSNPCNLSCAYCMRGPDTSSPIDMDRLKDGIQAFVGLAAPDGPLTLGFMGSEPLTIRPQVEALCETFRLSAAGRSVRFSMNTNLTLLDDAALDLLDRYDFTVHPSLDGPREWHDRIRKTRGGAGTFDTVMAALRQLQDRGFATVGYHLTLCDLNLDMPAKELADWTVSQGMTEVLVEPDLYGLKQDPEDVAEKLVEIHLAFLESGISCDGLWLRPYKRILQESRGTDLFGETDSLSACGAFGGRSLTLTTDGRILGCGYVPSLTLPNFESVHSEAWRAQQRTRVLGALEACRGCSIEGLCRGGCAVSWKSTGPNLILCEIYRSVTRRLLEASLSE